LHLCMLYLINLREYNNFKNSGATKITILALTKFAVQPSWCFKMPNNVNN